MNILPHLGIALVLLLNPTHGSVKILEDSEKLFIGDDLEIDMRDLPVPERCIRTKDDTDLLEMGYLHYRHSPFQLFVYCRGEGDKVIGTKMKLSTQEPSYLPTEIVLSSKGIFSYRRNQQVINFQGGQQFYLRPNWFEKKAGEVEGHKRYSAAVYLPISDKIKEKLTAIWDFMHVGKTKKKIQNQFQITVQRLKISVKLEQDDAYFQIIGPLRIMREEGIFENCPAVKFSVQSETFSCSEQILKGEWSIRRLDNLDWTLRPMKMNLAQINRLEFPLSIFKENIARNMRNLPRCPANPPQGSYRRHLANKLGLTTIHRNKVVTNFNHERLFQMKGTRMKCPHKPDSRCLIEITDTYTSCKKSKPIFHDGEKYYDSDECTTEIDIDTYKVKRQIFRKTSAYISVNYLLFGKFFDKHKPKRCEPKETIRRVSFSTMDRIVPGTIVTWYHCQSKAHLVEKVFVLRILPNRKYETQFHTFIIHFDDGHTFSPDNNDLTDAVGIFFSS